MDNRLLPDLQSAYRAFHSTETAVLKVLSDILLALDSWKPRGPDPAGPISSF